MIFIRLLYIPFVFIILSYYFSLQREFITKIIKEIPIGNKQNKLNCITTFSCILMLFIYVALKHARYLIKKLKLFFIKILINFFTLLPTLNKFFFSFDESNKILIICYLFLLILNVLTTPFFSFFLLLLNILDFSLLTFNFKTFLFCFS